MEKDFSVKEINVKERETFQNEGNLSDVHKDTKLVETTGTKFNAQSEKKNWYFPQVRTRDRPFFTAWGCTDTSGFLLKY